MRGRLYAISGSCPLTDVLAERFGTMYRQNPAELSKMVFLVPSRRTATALKDAFVRFNGKTPLLLPRIVPIGDMTEDDIFLLQADTKTILENLPSAIDEYERLFLFTRLIISRPQTYGLPDMTWGQAFALAGDLAKLLDTAAQENLSLADLKNLVPDQYAAHWQDTLKFLQIIMSYWPEILRERGVTDRVERYNAAVRFQLKLLRETPSKNKIIAAGLTGSTPLMREVLQTIADLPQGEVYLSDLDRFLDAEAWQAVDENHPQFAHKLLLETIGLGRDDIPDCVPPRDCLREAFVSEVMRPASDTWHWLSLQANPLPAEAVRNLHLIHCQDSRTEALTIALILRDTLNTPEKTAALVTTDRTLARRTSAELARWNIRIDDSAGKPLHLNPVGIFLRLILESLERHLSETACLSLLKNPFTHLGRDRATLQSQLRRWEKFHRTPRYDSSTPVPTELSEPMEELKHRLQPLVDLYAQNRVDFKTLLETHIETAESLAGAEVLWRGEDGRAAAALMSRLLPVADVIGQIDPTQYLMFLTAMLRTETVRQNYNSHPRLKILGPIEARFNHFDTIIIGGVNEGIWPETSSGDPWLSRPMKKQFGMPLPEFSVGVTAADFSRLLCAPEVYLTRAARSNGTPINKSRWLLRLETVLEASGFKRKDFEDSYYSRLAVCLDKARQNIRINPPAPCPPVSARPRRFSASALEMLMSDPYEFFAAYILKLKPLNPLDPKPSASDYGSLVHGVLEDLIRRYPNGFPENLYDIVLEQGRRALDEQKIAPEVRAFWWPAFLKAAEWFVRQEAVYHTDIVRSYPEVYGSLTFEAPEGTITLDARADRLDVTSEGKMNVIDYKTGRIRTLEQIRTGYAPQLPLEGMIAERGGFVTKQDGKRIPPMAVNGLIYWQLGQKEQKYVKDIPSLLDSVYTRLTVHLTAFDLPETPYPSRPDTSHVPSFPKYDHLARLKEWITEESDD